MAHPVIYDKTFLCTYQDISGDDGDTMYRRELLRACGNLKEYNDEQIELAQKQLFSFTMNDFDMKDIMKLTLEKHRYAPFICPDLNLDNITIIDLELGFMLLFGFDTFYMLHNYMATKDTGYLDMIRDYLNTNSEK